MVPCAHMHMRVTEYCTRSHAINAVLFLLLPELHKARPLVICRQGQYRSEFAELDSAGPFAVKDVIDVCVEHFPDTSVKEWHCVAILTKSWKSDKPPKVFECSSS